MSFAHHLVGQVSRAGVLGEAAGLPPADGGPPSLLHRRARRGQGVAGRLGLDANDTLRGRDRRRPLRVPGVLPPAPAPHGQPARR